ncbi:MAG: fatty acid hydroxylase [Paracoccaceae bacterium]|nr:MAG: sterol desaturase family protein [Alphaproteobacteria bacterium]GIX13379.1 MAG: fatty acid hydroxylase [Paracoccaceae bacterium]
MSGEAVVRLSAFGAVFAAMALWELAAPRRRREIPRLIRWTNNLAVVALDTLLVRLAFPVTAVGLAMAVEGRGWGLIPALGLPHWAAVAAGIVALDLIIYLQHVLFHAVPALWRLHRMHHADTEIDVSTGLRFHPLEILISMAIKLGAVAALGPPAVAVLAFEVILNASAMFSHSNVRLPAGVDRILRLVIVTPDMHRVHHSADPRETDRNFGFNLSLWDRLMGTYLAQPARGHDGMTVGLARWRSRRDAWLDRMLLIPLQGPARDPDPAMTPARDGTGASARSPISAARRRP